MNIYNPNTNDTIYVQDAYNGGGIYIAGGIVAMYGGTIHSNTARNGGAVYLSSGSFAMSGGSIGLKGGLESSQNVASSYGGGIFVESGSLTLNSALITNNSAANGGGVYAHLQGMVSIEDSEISKNIVNDLKKDDKAKKILGSSLDELDTSSSTTENNSSLYYSIYLVKSEIVTYEAGVKDNSKDYSIEFNDGTLKSFVIKEGNAESLKAIIEENNGTTTINLSNNNTNIGTVTISDNNISFNIIDEASNTSLNANITSTTEGNIITTTFNMAISNSDVNIDLLTLTDTKTLTDGVADFSNINTTNNIDINSLTETDITTIENNLMTILYHGTGGLIYYKPYQNMMKELY